MAALNDCKLAALKANTGQSTGSINDLELLWLKQETGATGTINDLWVLMLRNLGYSGTINDMQVASWKALGGTGETWNELAHWFWCTNGGAYGAAVDIQYVSGGSSYFPTGSQSTSEAVYSARSIGFTATSYDWSIVSSVPAGAVIITTDGDTCTVQTLLKDVDITYTLKCVASGPGGEAETETSFTNYHIENDYGALLANWRYESVAPLDYPSTVRVTGLVGEIRDESSNSYHMTPPIGESVALDTTGVFVTGWSIPLDGTQFLTVDTLPPVPRGTIVIPFRSPANVAKQRLYERGNALLTIEADGSLQFSLGGGAVSSVATGLDDGLDHHVIITWGENGLTLYTDSVKAINVGFTDLDTNAADITFGIGNDMATEPYTGNLGHIQVYPMQVSDAYAATLYTNRATLVESGVSLPYSVIGGDYLTSVYTPDFYVNPMIANPGDTVTFEFSVLCAAQVTGARIQIHVESGLEDRVSVYDSTTTLSAGTTVLAPTWATSSSNNVQGHRAFLTVKDSDGVILAKEEAPFDVTDNKVLVKRQSTIGTNTWGDPGTSDGEILLRVQRLRSIGINMHETFNQTWFYWVPNDDTAEAGASYSQWLYQTYDTPIARDRVKKIVDTLHGYGMLAYMYIECTAIKYSDVNGSILVDDSYKIRKNYDDFAIWQPFYDTYNCFAPWHYSVESEGTLTRTQFSDTIKLMIDQFGYDGLYIDGGWNHGVTTVSADYYRRVDGGPLLDNDGLAVTTGGQYGADWFGPGKNRIVAHKSDFQVLTNNFFTMTYPALLANSPGGTIEEIYGIVEQEGINQEVSKWLPYMDQGTTEGDPSNGAGYAQRIDEYVAVYSALIDQTGPQMQWARLSPGDIELYRTKMSLMLACGQDVNDANCMDTGGAIAPASGFRDSTRNYVHLTMFTARWSRWLNGLDRAYLPDPHSLFTVSADGAGDIFYDYSTFSVGTPITHYVINVMNLAENITTPGREGMIQAVTELAPPGQNAQLGIDVSLTHCRVFVLSPGKKAIGSVEIFASYADTSKEYFDLPIDLQTWESIVIMPTGVAVDVPVVIFNDTFTTGVEVDIESHTPDTQLAFGGWKNVPDQGSLVVKTDGRVYGTLSSSCAAVFPTSQPDGVLAMDFFTDSSAGGTVYVQGFYGRTLNSKNYFWGGVRYCNTVNPGIRLAVRVGDVNTNIIDTELTGIGPLDSGPYPMRLIAKGSILRYEIDVNGTTYGEQVDRTDLMDEMRFGLRIVNTTAYAENCSFTGIMPEDIAVVLGDWDVESTTALQSYTPALGGAFTILEGGIDVQIGSRCIGTAAGQWNSCSIDSVDANPTVTQDLGFVSSTNGNQGILVRIQDANNYWVCGMRNLNGANPYLCITKVEGGVETDIGISYPLGPTTAYGTVGGRTPVKAICDGDSIRVEVTLETEMGSGIERVYGLTVIDSTFNDQVGVGWRGWATALNYPMKTTKKA